MFFWRKKTIREEAEVLQLQRRLAGLEKLQLDTFQEQKMRKHLLMMIQQFAPEERFSMDLFRLQNQIKKSGSRLKISAKMQRIIKERIFVYIRRNVIFKGILSFRQPLFFWKQFVSATLVVSFVITAVFFWPSQVPVTLAADHTYFEEVSGKVSVSRDGKVYLAHKNFSLEEGDMLVTDADSLATIHFFDDSTSRLGQHTQLQLTRLYSEPLNPAATKIGVSLEEGQLWSRVFNLVDDNAEFVVDTNQTRVVVNKKAAFDVQVSSKKDVLTVFDNVVGFSVKNDIEFQSKPVLAGFQAKVDHNQVSKVAEILPIDASDSKDFSKQDWFVENLKQDKDHAQKFVVEKEDNFQTESDPKNDLVSPENEVHNTGKIIANAEIEKQRLYFLENYRILQKGETFLVRNNATEGLKLILQFQNVMRTFMRKVAEFEKKDPVNAALFRAFIESKIAEQRKDLATFLPGDALYPAKEIIENTELLLVDNDIDKTLIRLAQAEDKLLEIQNLVEQSKLQLAEAVLVRYKRQMDGFVLNVNKGDISYFKQNLGALLNQQFNQIKVLTAIEKSLNADNQKDFLVLVRKVRHEVLAKFVASVQILPHAVPLYLIRELKDLLQTYLANGVRDDEFVEMLNKLLVAHGEEVIVKSSDDFPDKLGVVTIVEDQVSMPIVSDSINTQEILSISTEEIESQQQFSEEQILLNKDQQQSQEQPLSNYQSQI